MLPVRETGGAGGPRCAAERAECVLMVCLVVCLRWNGDGDDGGVLSRAGSRCYQFETQAVPRGSDLDDRLSLREIRT